MERETGMEREDRNAGEGERSLENRDSGGERGPRRRMGKKSWWRPERRSIPGQRPLHRPIPHQLPTVLIFQLIQRVVFAVVVDALEKPT